MGFREKSAWAMVIVLGGAGLWYLSLAVGSWRELGEVPSPSIALPFVLLVVVASVVAQVVLAVSNPRDADRPADERERPIIDRAGNWSGLLLGLGTVTAMLHFLSHGDGNLLFHALMGSLIVASVAEYVFQIAMMRRGTA